MRRIFLLCMAVGMALSAWAKGDSDQLEVDENVVKGRLSNGLTYIIRHNENPKDRANFYIAQRVGAVLEDDSQDGLAHFLEHMAFNGTKNFPDKGIVDFLEKLGVKFGANINAYTSYDETVYNLDNVPTVRESIVDSALLVLHDWSGFITLDGKEIDKERGVIREEWRTRNTASRRIYFAHNRNTKQGTPYAVRDITGDTAVINNFAYDELRRYYQKWYRPDLQGIIVVGDIDPKAVEKSIKKLWKDIPAKKDAAERVFNSLPANAEPLISIVTDDEATQTTVEISFRDEATPFDERNTRADYAQTIRMLVAETAISKRLDELTNKQNSPCAYAATGVFNEAPLTESFYFAAVAKPDATAATLDFLFDEVEKVRRYGLTQTELDYAKAVISKGYADAYEGRAKRDNDSYTQEYVSAFTDCEPIPGIEREVELAEEALSEITLEAVNQMLAGRLERNVVIEIGAPTSDKQVPTSEECLKLYRAAQAKDLEAYENKEYAEKLVDEEPKAGELVNRTKDALWTAEEWRLSNGVRLFLMPTNNTDNEILLAAQSYGGISVLDTADVLDASLVGRLANQSGKGEFDIDALEHMLANKSVALSASINSYSEVLRGQCTTNDFGTLMQLIYLSFAPMRDDADAFGTLIDAYRTQLINASRNPQRAFSDTLSTTLMNGNPYYQPLKIDNIDRLSHERMREIYNQKFDNAAAFTFFIVGAFEPDSLRSDILTWLGSLPTNDNRRSYTPRDFYNPEGVIEKTFARQMTTHKASNAVVYSGRGEYSLRNSLTLTILKDLLNMRYLETIREDEGGTYGVRCRSSFSGAVEQEFTLSMTFDTDPALVDRLLPMIEKEVRTIATDGPVEIDFRKVKETLVKERKERFQDDGFWLSLMTNKVMWNLDSYTDYESTVESITMDDVQQMAERILSTGNRVTISMMPEEGQTENTTKD